MFRLRARGSGQVGDPHETTADHVGGVIPESAYVDDVHLDADAHDKLWKVILNDIWGPLLQRCLQ